MPHLSILEEVLTFCMASVVMLGTYSPRNQTQKNQANKRRLDPRPTGVHFRKVIHQSVFPLHIPTKSS